MATGHAAVRTGARASTSRVVLVAAQGWFPGTVLAELARWQAAGWGGATLVARGVGVERGPCRWWAREVGPVEVVRDLGVVVVGAAAVLGFLRGEDAVVEGVVEQAGAVGVPVVLFGGLPRPGGLRWVRSAG